MIAAVFDLDRTLLPDTTAERIFLRHLIRARVLGPGAALKTARYGLGLGTGLQDVVQRIRADRPYLTGLHEATLTLHGLRCAREAILPVLSSCGLECLNRHQECGHHTVLLSGSLPYVVEPVADALKIEHVICSRMNVTRQRLTGGLKGLHPYGEAKAKLICDYANQFGLDLSNSYCYADHHTDVPMLRAFGYPVCVNPSEALRQVAQECGWQIESFR